VSPPSHCVACEAPIRPYDNIPVISYVALRGRCRACHTRIPPRTRCWSSGPGSCSCCLPGGWARRGPCRVLRLRATAVAISAIDIEHMRIPSAVVYATAVLGAPLLVLASAGTHDWSALESAAIGGAARSRPSSLSFTPCPRASVSATCASPVCAEVPRLAGLPRVVAGFLISFVVAACPPLAARDAQGEAQTKIPSARFSPPVR